MPRIAFGDCQTTTVIHSPPFYQPYAAKDEQERHKEHQETYGKDCCNKDRGAEH